MRIMPFELCSLRSLPFKTIVTVMMRNKTIKKCVSNRATPIWHNVLGWYRKRCRVDVLYLLNGYKYVL